MLHRRRPPARRRGGGGVSERNNEPCRTCPASASNPNAAGKCAVDDYDSGKCTKRPTDALWAAMIPNHTPSTLFDKVTPDA